MLNSNIAGVVPEKGEVLARLTYIQKEVSEPLISSVTQKFGILLNILLADVEIVSGSPIGGTVVKFNGESIRIDEAIQYLREKQVGVEVIKDARNPY